MNLWENRNWKPMLLKEINRSFNSKEHLFELKFDGIRAVIYVSPKEFQIKTRNGKDITYLYPELKEIQSLVKNKTIFDGEIIIMDNGHPSFHKLQERSHLKSEEKIKYNSVNNPVVFICFDIIYSNESLINIPLIRRKALLDRYADNNFFVKSKYVEEKGIDLFKFVKKMNLEGIVAKLKDSLYEINTRSSSWIKIKNIQKEWFYIGGYIEKENSFTISLYLGEYRNNLFCYVGKVTLGKKKELYKKVKHMKSMKESPFIDFEENITYIKPNIKCQVNFLERTENNSLRQPYIS